MPKKKKNTEDTVSDELEATPPDAEVLTEAPEPVDAEDAPEEEEVTADEADDDSDDVDATSPSKPKINRHDRFNKLMASKTMMAIQKEHGKGIIRRSSEHHASHSYYIPTGILPLDYALGGGWRVGAIHTLWGNKSGGKTTTLLKTIGMSQQMCANCWTFAEFSNPTTGEYYKKPKCKCGKYREVVAAYIDVESTWDDDWAKRNQVQTDRTLLCVPEYAEQSLDIAEGLLRSGDCDVLALDSLAFLTPEKEINESNSKLLMGEQPRVVGKGVRKFVAALNHMGNQTERRPTLFFTNQVRMKLGLMFGNPETQPAGQAPQFASTTEVRFTGGKYDLEKEKKSKDSEENAAPGGMSKTNALSVEIPFRIEKSKQGAPKRDGSYNLILADTEFKRKGDVYDEPVLMAEAERYEIIKPGSGSKWECAGVPFTSKKAIEEALMKSGDFKRLLSSQVLSCLLA